MSNLFDSLPKKNMKGDLPAFLLVPIVFLILIVVAAVLIQAWGIAEPIEANIMIQTVGTNAINATFPAGSHPIAAWQGIGNILFSFNNYLPIIFYGVMLAVVFNTLFIQANAIDWLVSFLFIPIIYWISDIISNIARVTLTQPTIATGVASLQAPAAILANLGEIILIFSILYIIALSIRLWFSSNANLGNPQGGAIKG